MKKLLILFFLLVNSTSLFAKPTAVLYPIKFTGLESTSKQQILQNHISGQLGAYFSLKTQKELDAAINQVRDIIASDNCTEDACIKKINSVLSVAFSYNFQIIVDGDYWDITANRIDDLGQTSNKNSSCNKCTLAKAKLALSDIVVSLNPSASTVNKGKGKLILKSTPNAEVFLNGRIVGSTPIELDLDASKTAEITLAAEGYKAYSTVFTLQSGKVSQPSLIVLARQRGEVKILSNPTGARIFSNGAAILGANNQQATTPYIWRPVFGKQLLTLKKKSYEDANRTISVDSADIKEITFSMESLPARLIIKVPSKFKQAQIYINGSMIGNMGGKFIKSFDVPANKNTSVFAAYKGKMSEKKSVFIEPDGSKTIELVQSENLSLANKSKSKPKQSNKKPWYAKFTGTGNKLKDFNSIKVDDVNYELGLASLSFNMQFQEGEDSVNESTAFTDMGAGIGMSVENGVFGVSVAYAEAAITELSGLNTVGYHSLEGEMKSGGIFVDYLLIKEKSFPLILKAGLGYNRIGVSYSYIQGNETKNRLLFRDTVAARLNLSYEEMENLRFGFAFTYGLIGQTKFLSGSERLNPNRFDSSSTFLFLSYGF